MSENISRLMDGEVDATELDAVCAALKSGEAMASWNCYHVIGDALRGEIPATRDVRAAVARRLADEPTVLAPQRSVPSRPAAWAWAAAATLAAVSVVGWTAYSLIDATPAGLAKAGDAGAMRASEVRVATVPTDLLFAHQEYAPASMLQGVGPYLRDVAVTREVKP
jgi:sigma-E factor negative regulatory protein RseA